MLKIMLNSKVRGHYLFNSSMSHYSPKTKGSGQIRDTMRAFYFCAALTFTHIYSQDHRGDSQNPSSNISLTGSSGGNP